MAKLTCEAWLEKYYGSGFEFDKIFEFNKRLGGKEKMSNNLFEIEYVNLGNGYYSWWTNKISKDSINITKLDYLVKEWNSKIYKTEYKNVFIDFTIDINAISDINMLFVNRDFKKEDISIDLCEINEEDDTLVDTIKKEEMDKFLLFINYINEYDTDLEKEVSNVVTENNKYDKVEKPKHYVLNIKGNEIQVIDIIDEVVKDYEPQEAFKIANVIKYILRASKKNGKEDLKKARKYIDMLVGEKDE